VVEACDRHYTLDDGRLVDHVAEVDLGPWTQEARRPEPVPSTARPATPADQHAGAGDDLDDSVFRRPPAGPA
jgi:hypothetical protein